MKLTACRTGHNSPEPKRRFAARSGGYTLIELIVAVGLFAIIMTLASGAYLVMIGANRNTQALATGINNLSFVLESMTRTIRTGTAYQRNGTCDFSFIDQNGIAIRYQLGSQAGLGGVGTVGAILRNNVPITSSAIDVTSCQFYTYGLPTEAAGDVDQPRVTMTVGGTVSTGPGRTQSFAVQSGATQRGSDL